MEVELPFNLFGDIDLTASSKPMEIRMWSAIPCA